MGLVLLSPPLQGPFPPGSVLSTSRRFKVLGCFLFSPFLATLTIPCKSLTPSFFSVRGSFLVRAPLVYPQVHFFSSPFSVYGPPSVLQCGVPPQGFPPPLALSGNGFDSFFFFSPGRRLAFLVPRSLFLPSPAVPFDWGREAFSLRCALITNVPCLLRGRSPHG